MPRRPHLAALCLFALLGGIGIAPAFAAPATPTATTPRTHPAPVGPPIPTPTTVPPPPAPPPAVAPPPPPPPVPKDDTWDVVGPRIRGCESGGSPMARGNYAAVNRRSGASGAYQFTDDTWGGRYGVRSAAQATPEQQDRAAYETYQRRGTSPWRFSAACWRVSASRS